MTVGEDRCEKPGAADPHDRYNRAFELAATSRYREARELLEKMVSERPDDVDALVLLGKVEYYLRRYTSSRRRFEHALTYDPGNTPAWFGLQFYRERRRTLVIGLPIALAFVIVLLVAAGAYAGMRSQLRRLDTVSAAVERSISSIEKIETSNDRMSHRLDAIESLLENRMLDIDTRLETFRVESGESAADIRNRLREVSATQSEILTRLRRIERSVVQVLLEQIGRFIPSVMP